MFCKICEEEITGGEKALKVYCLKGEYDVHKECFEKLAEVGLADVFFLALEEECDMAAAPVSSLLRSFSF